MGIFLTLQIMADHKGGLPCQCSGSTNINISCSGHSYLGSPLGSSAFVDNFVSEKIDQWSEEIRLLTAIALTQPHAAFAALTHGLSSKWSYLSCTTASLSSHFQKLEDLLRFQLIPTLTGNAAPDIDHQLFALPAREGGLGIVNLASSCDLEYSTSRAISEPLTRAILQGMEYSDQLTAKL